MKDTSEKNKQSALDFLKLVITGHIDKAYEKYVDMKGKHHNAYTLAGFSALQKGMKDADIQFPHKQFSAKHILGDGDLVAIHSHLLLEVGKTDLVVVHLFRFKDDKIVEMWDLGQAITPDLLNKDG